MKADVATNIQDWSLLLDKKLYCNMVFSVNINNAFYEKAL